MFPTSAAPRTPASNSSPSPTPARNWKRWRANSDSAHLFFGDPAIGGRFSVLSKFGLVAAAAIGLDVARLLAETQRMVTASHAMVPPVANPGIRLGVTLGVLATKCGRDKITIIASPALASIGAWLEQLIAESTGKHGKGLIPVDGEPLGGPDVYGNDRVFVHVHLSGSDDLSAKLKALEDKGHPVIRITIGDSYQLGQICYLWEMAIAAAGAVIGINPFDQPDVEASKNKTRDLTNQYETSGALPEDAPDVPPKRHRRLWRCARRASSCSNARNLGDVHALSSRPHRGRRLFRAARLYREFVPRIIRL